MRQPACVPTWNGRIETTRDALLIFEACFQGTLLLCSSRPHNEERKSLIASGNVFVYEEAASGIKRWTDGIPWSPSRILTNSLIYRQLNHPFPPAEKKRANTGTQRPPRSSETHPTPISTSNNSLVSDYGSPLSQSQNSVCAERDDRNPNMNSNRSLVGSLVDSYEFEEGGLFKKTIKVTVRDRWYRLISYYSLEDAEKKLRTPRDDSQLKEINISQELLQQTQFKVSNLDDPGDGSFDVQDHYRRHEYYHMGGYYSYPWNHMGGFAYSAMHTPYHFPIAGYAMPS